MIAVAGRVLVLRLARLDLRIVSSETARDSVALARKEIGIQNAVVATASTDGESIPCLLVVNTTHFHLVEDTYIDA
jgi:hypothetical protein